MATHAVSIWDQLTSQISSLVGCQHIRMYQIFSFQSFLFLYLRDRIHHGSLHSLNTYLQHC